MYGAGAQRVKDPASLLARGHMQDISMWVCSGKLGRKAPAGCSRLSEEEPADGRVWGRSGGGEWPVKLCLKRLEMF